MKYRVLMLILILVVSILCSCAPDHTHTPSDEYSFNDTHHWHQCECGEKDGYAEHTWDDGVIIVRPTTEIEGVMTYTCTVCSYKKYEQIDKITADHQHSYDIFYDSDEHSHTFECICGEKDDASNHEWDEGEITTPATVVETGIMTYTCTDCGHKSTQTIASTRANGLSFVQSTHHRISNKLSATPLTIEAEIYVPQTQSARAGAIFGNYNGVRENWLFEIHENGVPRFYYNDSTDAVRDIRFSHVDVRTGDWVHIALTFDFEQGAISLYLDGEVAEVLPCSFDFTDDITRYEFVLGGDNRSNNGNYFQGQIRSVAAYSDIRTAKEIAASAENGINLYADDILVSYLLNENSAANDIVDLTGNGYDIPKEWIDTNEVELDYAYSFAVIGDTQWLSRYKPEEMETIYDWLLANKDSRKIAHVFGLGDITDAWNTADKENEWIRAYEYISKLDGVIPYSLTRGNHDESKYFLKYFANSTYMNQFDGFIAEGDIRNSYMLVTIGSTDYLFLTLDYAPSDAMLDWANEVVASHPDRRVIVTTHAYQGYDGGHLNPDNVNNGGDTSAAGTDVDTSVNGGVAVRDHNNGQQIWEKFVSLHPNISLVLSGHTPLEDVFVLESEGVHGNIVTQMLIDAQWMDPQKDGAGMVCMLYFSEDGSQMEVEWLSAETGKYYKEMNQFQLDLTDSLSDARHDFESTYDEKSHNKACDCGCVISKPHSFDDGVLNADGLMEYSCDCGYKKTVSASKATITLVGPNGEALGVEYVTPDADGFCRFTPPEKAGLVPEYDYLILDVKHDNLEKTVYYSAVDVWNGTSVSTSLSGNGTATSPYLIQSGADLAYVAKVVNATTNTDNFKGVYFKMTKSIDLNGHELRIGSFTNIDSKTGGLKGNFFNGYFDGNHCTIRGINATQSLFGVLKDGYIKNLSTYGTVATTQTLGVAGLVSYMTDATVENITNYVNVTGVQQVAGVVGWLENNTTTFAKNCVNYGTVYATSYQIGGIAGFAKGSLSGCRNFGDVTSTKSGYVGGIGGAAKDAKGSRSDCVNYGNISGADYTGGCFGMINKTTTDCYSYGTATAPTANKGEVVGNGASFLTYTE